jgi:hypothetical protein
VRLDPALPPAPGRVRPTEAGRNHPTKPGKGTD